MEVVSQSAYDLAESLWKACENDNLFDHGIEGVFSLDQSNNPFLTTDWGIIIPIKHNQRIRLVEREPWFLRGAGRYAYSC